MSAAAAPLASARCSGAWSRPSRRLPRGRLPSATCQATRRATTYRQPCPQRPPDACDVHIQQTPIIQHCTASV
eukprot:5493179-Pyramimonas_sp.AAC.1